jgi:hypothetical protein
MEYLKKKLVYLFLILTGYVHSQVIQVNINTWCDYEHPKSMTLHTAMNLDSVTTIQCWKGHIELTFNFQTATITIIDTFGKIQTFEIVNNNKTPSILNVDAKKDSKYYNFVVSQNLTDTYSLIIQNFEKKDGKSVGTFSNKISLIFK